MIQDQINEIFSDCPSRHPSFDDATNEEIEVAQIKKAVLLLAKELDKQNEEMAAVHKVATEILSAVNELDKRF